MKKHEEIEMKIYELLGVKYFKKLAISLVDITFLPFTLKAYKGLSLKERVFKINHVKSNYFIGKINSMEELKRYQHCLLFLKHESDRIKKSIDCHEEPNIKLTAPFSKEKTLKLEIGSRRSNEKDNN